MYVCVLQILTVHTYFLPLYYPSPQFHQMSIVFILIHLVLRSTEIDQNHLWDGVFEPMGWRLLGSTEDYNQRQ